MPNPFEMPLAPEKKKEDFKVKAGDVFEFADARGIMRKWNVLSVDEEGKIARMKTTDENQRSTEGNMTFSGLEKASLAKNERDKVPIPKETVAILMENGLKKTGVVIDINEVRKSATVRLEGGETAGVDLSRIERLKEAA